MTMMLFIYWFLLEILFISTNQFTDQRSLKQTRKAPTAPQSLTLLMNFKDDGTTSFQIMQGKFNLNNKMYFNLYLGSQIVYLDNGFCQYGQLFDPSTGRCRDIYCQELYYKFNGTTCIPDESKNATHVYKRMSDIDLSLTLIIAPRNHFNRSDSSKRLRSQMNKTCTNNWNQMFHDTLHGKFCLFNWKKD